MKILHLLDERWDSGLTQYALQVVGLLQKAGHHAVLGALREKIPFKMAFESGLRPVPFDSLSSLRALIRQEQWDVINVHTGRMHSWTLVFAPRSTAIVRTRGDARPISANPLLRLIYRKTDAVIAASEHIAHMYEEELGLREDKVHVVYPSIKADSSFAAASTGRVGILGRLDPVKGHAIFLEAVADVVKERPQTKFLIAGKEANIQFDLLKNQIKELGIEQAVEYLGFQASALDFMRSCSIGVIASIGSEEISRACLEWMAVGRPVVGTLVGCLPELIEPDETGYLVPPGDGLAMGDAILKLLRDPAHATDLGHHAQNLIKNKFSPEVQLKNTLAVYEAAAHRAH